MIKRPSPFFLNAETEADRAPPSHGNQGEIQAFSGP
jgi:hypothetical protein